MNVILIILGAVCQILGLWWLAVNVSRERVELGEAGFVQRIWESLKLLLGPMPKPVSVTAVDHVDAVSGSAHASGYTETEMERVQREVRELRERLDGFQIQIQARVAAVEQTLDEKHDLLAARVTEIETRLREARRAELRQNRWAGRLFAVGAALSAAGALV